MGYSTMGVEKIRCFPEEYIKTGNFKLHSGDRTNIFYDINAMITNNEELYKIQDFIPFHSHVYHVGIATGGAIIAAVTASNWCMFKDGELKGDLNGKPYILIDDVITTGNSLREAVRTIGYAPRKIYVIVDRRNKKGRRYRGKSKLDIKSMYDLR